MEEIKIIGLEKKPRSKKFKVITNDNDYTFSEDTIIKYMIFKDKVFSKVEWDKVLNDAILDEYFNKVLNYLGSSYKSIYEIKKYLQDKSKKNNDKLTNEQIEEIISRISNLGYLNDEMLAKNVCDYYYRNNKGPNYIKQKLLEKKVDEKIINEALKDYSTKRQEEVVKNIIQKEKNDKYPLKKFIIMLTSKLINNGFDYEIVNQVINSFEFDDKQNELIVKDYEKITRKLENKELSSYEYNNKIISYLLNKGYDYYLINDYMKSKDGCK